MNVTHITECPGHLFAMVVKDFEGRIRFTVFQQHPNGETSIEYTEPFAYHDEAIAAWVQYSSNRPWPDDTSRIGQARRVLDFEQ